MEHNLEKLKEHILPLSQSKIWSVAKSEWHFETAYIDEGWGNCPCGKDIKEHCVIANSITGEETVVGNVCVNNFMGISSGTMFDGIRRIAASDTATAGMDLVKNAYARRVINDWEYNFYIGTVLKRKLSQKQSAIRQRINAKILRHYVK